MSIRLKIIAIVFLLLALVGAAFVAYSVDTTANYRLLRMEGVRKTVEFASEKVNKTIAEMERNAVDLANSGRTLFFSGNRSDSVGEAVVIENFEAFPAAVGGGLWYEPNLFRSGERRVCFYALRDAESGAVRIDPDFRSEEYDYLTQSWYTEIAAAARRRHMTAWTRPYFDDTGTLALMTTVGAGIYDRDRLVGMSTVDWEIDSVVASLAAIQPTPGSFVLLCVPRDDYVISNTYGRSNAAVGTSLKTVPWYAEIGHPPIGDVSVSSFAFRGVEYVAFSRLMDNGWLLSVPIPQREIFAEIEGRNRRFSRMLGFSSIALLALAWWLVSRLVNRPISRLIGDIEELGRGNLDARIDVRRRDEIGRLGAAFNKMTGDLQESLERSARERSERDRIAGELNVATRIQTGMLPCTFPAFPERGEFDIYAVMQPAREVGGDFYDFFLVDDRRLAVVVADVSGKGIPAALFMVISRTLIKNNAQSGKSPAEVFAVVNNLLCENNDAGMFVTAFMGYLDMDSGKFTYVNAGHNPPLLRRAGGGYSVLPTRPGLTLAAMDSMAYGEDGVTLGPDDALFLYTDGVTEADNAAGELFGMERLLAAADSRRDLPLKKLLSGVKEDIDAFAAGAEQADDITMLALRMAGGGKGRMEELVLEATLDNLHRAQDFVAETLAALECPPKLVNQIDLVLEELFVNVANYAYGGGAGEVVVRAGVDGDAAVIALEDGGAAFNPLEKADPDITQSAEDRPVGGLGIFMAKQIMDRLDYQREGGRNRLTAWKAIPEARSKEG